jgi:hypothetical protein
LPELALSNLSLDTKYNLGFMVTRFQVRKATKFKHGPTVCKGGRVCS